TVSRQSDGPFRLEPGDLVHCVLAYQPLPPRHALLFAVVRVNQLVVPDPRLIVEHVLERPRPGVFPGLPRIALPVGRPSHDFIRLTVQDQDLPAIRAPPRNLGGTAFAKPPVRLREPLIEALLP